MKTHAAFLAILASSILHPATRADDLETGFRSPPHSAGIRCFWWWLNGNVTEEAITRDLEEMKAKGFSGALIFDADGSAQQGNTRTPAGPAFGSPEWTNLFVHACREAKRLDLELSLNIQSGWNLGGPSVTAEQTTQRLVWSKTTVDGPATIEASLPQTRTKDGFYPRRLGASPCRSAGTPRPPQGSRPRKTPPAHSACRPRCPVLVGNAGRETRMKSM